MTSILGPKLPLLLAEVRRVAPQCYIEVGCYRCDTMLAVKAQGVPRVIGFDLFEPSETEFAPLDGPPLTWEKAQALALSKGLELYRGNTRDSLRMLPELNLPDRLFVFLDGGHSYETAKSDWTLVEQACPGATVLFDDITYPGVAQVIREIPADRLRRFLGYYLILVEPKS